MSRAGWLVFVGTVVVGLGALALFARPPKRFIAKVDEPAPVRPAVPAARPPLPSRWNMPAPPFDGAAFARFLADVRRVEAMPDGLARCLAYPDPPGANWSRSVAEAYCHYHFDPFVPVADVRRLVTEGRADELDRRLADAERLQAVHGGDFGLLDRTFNLDFEDGSPAMRDLVDAWKRQSPESAFAFAASGIAYLQSAQEARGTRYVSDTPASALRTMGDLLVLARGELEHAVSLDPRLTPAYAAMITAGMLEGDVDYAVEAGQRALAANPADFSVYIRLATLADPKWSGSTDQVRELALLARHWADGNPLMRLLAAAESGGESYVERCPCGEEDAYAVYRTAFAEVAPVNLLASAADGAERRSAFQLSFIYRSELLRFEPASSRYRAGRIYDLVRLGQGDWALEEGNALVSRDPKDHFGFEMRGYAYAAAGDVAHARSDYQRALALDPQSAWTRRQLDALPAH